MGCTGAAGHLQQTQERSDAKELGHWLIEECLPLCTLPVAWWETWWAGAVKSRRKALKACKGPAPAPISACEWLNRYATHIQKFLAPWKLGAQTGVPEQVIKLALQCRCTPTCNKCHRNVGRFRGHASGSGGQRAKAAGTRAAYFEAWGFVDYECRPCTV